LGLLLALLSHKPPKEHGWPAKALSVLAILLLIGGAFLTFLTSAVGTTVDGAITLFFVLGFLGYLLMIRSILTPTLSPRGYLGAGFVLLFLLATWSWASALGMYFHRGAIDDTTAACILVSKPIRYETELNSIWEMRLPEVSTNGTGPRGTYIWDYHAILVAPSSGPIELYNWSKRRMRFESLDAERNPYLPIECP